MGKIVNAKGALVAPLSFALFLSLTFSLSASDARHAHVHRTDSESRQDIGNPTGEDSERVSGESDQATQNNAISTQSENASAAESSENQSAGGESGDARGSASTAGEPHTLLYYVIQGIATLIAFTLIMGFIGSFNVIFLAGVWHSLKLFNGGKKPSIV